MLTQYGVYVWASYGIAMMVLAVFLMATLRALGQSRSRLEKIETFLKKERSSRHHQNGIF